METNQHKLGCMANVMSTVDSTVGTCTCGHSKAPEKEASEHCKIVGHSHPKYICDYLSKPTTEALEKDRAIENWMVRPTINTSEAPTDESWGKTMLLVLINAGVLHEAYQNSILNEIASLLEKESEEARREERYTIFSRERQIGDNGRAQQMLDAQFEAGKSEAYATVRKVIEGMKIDQQSVDEVKRRELKATVPSIEVHNRVLSDLLASLEDK